MATARDPGEAGRHKAVPSWLNSPAWSTGPSRGAPKKANPYVPQREKSLVRGNDVAEKRGEDVQEDRANVQQGNLSGSCNGSPGSKEKKWTSSDSFPPGLSSPSANAHSATSSESDQSSKGSSSVDDACVELFTIELSRKRIHLAELQRMSAQGIPAAGGLRSLTWKLLLGYLPRNAEDWAGELAKKRLEYAGFREELLVTPSELTRRKEAYESHLASHDNGDGGFLPRHNITHEDHPLSLGSTSVWHQFFQDTELSDQIVRDVKRTHPDIQFFCGDSKYALENQEALKRALFIFAKLNPGIRYVQGMNEVLAPLYFVFRTDPDEAYSAHAEADAFFCFVELLSDFRDNFCQQLDNSAVGIRATLSQLNSLLRRSDEELWRHLELTAKVNPQFYAFRWITLLLTQEFEFFDCLRLWDTFLSNPDGPLEILLRVSCAMLLCVRSRLLAGDFTTNLKLLQNYPTVNINHLLSVADELRG